MSNRTPSSGQISFDNLRDTVGNFDNQATGRTNANATNNPDGITIGSGTGVAMNEYIQYRDQRGLQHKTKASNSLWNISFDFSNLPATDPNYVDTGVNNTAEVANTKPLGPFGHHQSGRINGKAYFNEDYTAYGQNFSTGQSMKDFYNMGNKKSFNISVGHEAVIKGKNTNYVTQSSFSYLNLSNTNAQHNNIPSFVGRRLSANNFNGTNAYANYKANKVQTVGRLHFGSTGNGSMGNITTPDGANWPIVAVGFVPKYVHTGSVNVKRYNPHFILMVQGAFRSGPSTRQLGWGTNSASTESYWVNNYMNNTVATNSIKWSQSAGVTVGNKNYKGLFKGIKVNFGTAGRKFQAPNSNDPTFSVRGQLSHDVKTFRNNSAGGDHVFMIGDNKSYDGYTFGTYGANANSYAPEFIASDHGINNATTYTWEARGSSWAGPSALDFNDHYTVDETLGHPDYSRWVWDVPSSLYDSQWFTDTYGNNADTGDNGQQWAYIKYMWQSGKNINIEILEH